MDARRSTHDDCQGRREKLNRIGLLDVGVTAFGNWDGRRTNSDHAHWVKAHSAEHLAQLTEHPAHHAKAPHEGIKDILLEWIGLFGYEPFAGGNHLGDDAD